MAEVIVALDVTSRAEALRLADGLPGLRWVKVGPMLFLREGRELVEEFKARDVRVFLDLKWHDIPNSVAEAARAAAEIGVDLATVHALGGRRMLEAAASASGMMRIAAVSVLTSHGPADYWETVGLENGEGADLGAEVRRLARLASEAGVHAVVASPLEIAVVREVIPTDRWIVTPGIRPEGSAADDQQRIATPRAAAAAGATHLVIGRPITRAKHPGAVYESIREELS